MARPQQGAIDMFMNITGATEALAVQKLEEHGGDLNQAVNAYYSEGDRVNLHASPLHNARDNFVNIDDPMDADVEVSPFPNVTASRSFNSFSVLDSSFPQGLFGGRDSSGISNRAPWVSHPREVREIPIDFKDGSSQSGHSMPMIEDITGDTAEQGSEVRGAVVIDNDDNEDLSLHPASRDGRRHNDFNSTIPGTSAPRIDSISDLNNDIEEEMIRAAIEASKQEVEGHRDNRSGVSHTADDEEASHVQGTLRGHKGSSSLSGGNMEEQGKVATANGRQGFHQLHSETAARSSDEDVEEIEEQPLVRRRSRPFPRGRDDSTAEVESVDELPSHPEPQNNHPQLNGDSFHSYEWGGISSQEHDEAVMLEAAMFGGVPESSAYNFGYPSQTADRHAGYYPRIPRSPSPTLAAQRLLREQQDDEYLAALQLDREKAELRLAEEAAARNAALEEEKLQKEEEKRKLQEKEEFERQLSAKQASLPHEPALDDENAVTLLIRMPDGSRFGRRFLKSDKLQSLFDFIDVGRMVTPGTYRLVNPYPRRAFGEGENAMSLCELGLTSKQEALFLELI